MSLWLAIVALVAGIAVVIAGAEGFLDGLIGAARRHQVPVFALTLLVSGFEIENLAAGIAANLAGLPGAAAGTFLGGTTFLALAVAGLGGLLAPVRLRVPTGVLVLTALSPLPLLLTGLDGTLSRLDGLLLLGWFALVMVGMARSGAHLSDEDDDDDDDEAPKRRPWLWVLGGLAAMAVGGQLLGEGLRTLVLRAGVSQTLLGNTAIAAAVEAEEIGRVVAPARRGRGSLAVANVAGTIAHFAALNAGVIALVRPLPLDLATRTLHLPAAALAALAYAAVLGLGGGVSRLAGSLLLAGYVAYVALAVRIG